MKQSRGSPIPATATIAAGSRSGPGLLFVDLRGLDELIEARGAPGAAATLFDFRNLVETAVASQPGASIRTEGSSFYVVFPAAGPAVECGPAIAHSATTAGPGGSALSVALGVDSGVVPTPDGYLAASAVCAAAAIGEVVVTAAVRAETRALPLNAVPARRALPPGLANQRQLFLVTAAIAVASSGRHWRSVPGRRWVVPATVVVAVAAVVVAVGAGWWPLHPSAGLPPGGWTIGVLVPEGNLFARMSDDFGTQQVNAIKLAVDDANAAGWTGGLALALDIRNEGGPYEDESVTSAANNFVTNPSVFAIVGPSASSHAAAEIPLTNRAGLLQCSPATTAPTLTKPRFGARELRPAFPDRISFVRLATSDDVQGPAGASYVFNDLHAAGVLIVDDTSDAGRQAASSFELAYGSIVPTAGSIVRRSINPGSTDFTDVLAPLRGTGTDIGAVYFGGTTTFDDSPYSGPVLMKQAMMAMGFLGIPVQSWDGLWDGPGTDATSFIGRAGAAAANTYATRPSTGPINAEFAARYRTAFGVEPSEFAAAAYGCTQIILEGLRHAADGGVNADGLREAVRSYVVDPAHLYQTVLGVVGFDANGDSTQQFVTFYRTDLGANAGKGDWIVVKQQDFGPAQ